MGELYYSSRWSSSLPTSERSSSLEAPVSPVQLPQGDRQQNETISKNTEMSKIIKICTHKYTKIALKYMNRYAS